MSQPVAIALFILAAIVTIDIVLVRRRAAAEATALHVALSVMTEHLAALGSINDAWAYLESAPGFLVVRDRNAAIRYVTPACAKMMNSTPERLLGSTTVSLKDKTPGSKTLDDFNYLTLLSGKPQTGEVNYTPPGTGEVWRMEFHITALREAGQITGTITVLTNISNIYTSRW